MIRTCETIRRGQTSIAATILVALALAAGSLWPAAASADVGMQIIERCGNGLPLAGFTVKQYRRAIQEMPTEAIEYTDCAERIDKAELAAASGHGGTGGGGSGPGGSTAAGAGAGQAIEPTPAEQKTLETVRHAGVPAVRLANTGETVLPGVVHPNLASATSDLPAPVLAVIALVLAGLLLLAGLEIRGRLTRASQS